MRNVLRFIAILPLASGCMHPGAAVLVAATAVTTAAIIHANKPPPPEYVEMVPVAPAPNQVYCPGFWDWRNNEYVWVTGFWTIPPKPGLVCIPPRWSDAGDGTWKKSEPAWR